MSDPEFRPPVTRWILTFLLTVYAGFLLLLALLASWSNTTTPTASPLKPLLRAEAAAMSRLQAQVRHYSPQAADWMNPSLETVFRETENQRRPDFLIWLGETQQAVQLGQELNEAKWGPFSTAIYELYVSQDTFTQASVEAVERDLLPQLQGYFLERAEAQMQARQAGKLQAEAPRDPTVFLAAGLGSLILMMGMIGVLLLFTGWLWLNKAHPRETFPPPAPGPFRFRDVYLAFLTWLCLNFSVAIAVDLLGLPPRFAVASLLLTFLTQGLIGWLLLHRILAPGVPGTVFLGSLLHGPARLGAGRTVAWWLGGYAITLPVVIAAWLLTEALLGQPPVSENPLIPMLFESRVLLDRIGLLFVVAVLAPTFEEILFRGILMPGLRQRLGATPAILISGLLFGAIHFDPMALLPLSGLGCVLGYVAHRSGSLIPAILLHALWNSQSFVQLELLRRLS